MQPNRSQTTAEFRPSLDVSLPRAKRGIGLRSPLLTPDGRALHDKPTINLNELIDEPLPTVPEVPIHVADYSLPPLEKIDLPCPLPKKMDDFLRKPEVSPIALQHKPSNPGGRETAERSRLSLFQDDAEFHDSLTKITTLPDWEPLRELGEEKPLPPPTSGVFSVPPRLFDDEKSPSPPDPFDNLLKAMPDRSHAAVVTEIPPLQILHPSLPRRRTGPVFRRTLPRNVTKKDEVSVIEQAVANEIVTPMADVEPSLRVYDESIPATPPRPGEVLLVTDELTKSYYKGKLKIPVLKGVNFSVQDGEFVAIVGQSGSGKSTLLHLLGTLDNPESGTIYFDGTRIDNLPIARRDQLRNRSIGFIFQFYHLLPELTTLENVLSPLMVRESVWGYFLRRREHIETAKRLLDQVGLSHRLNHRPSELSGGEMQRAAIARALVSEPRILLADEPTGNLDAQSAKEIIELLRVLNQEHRLTIVMVTHDLGVAQSADRVVRMIDGRVEK